MNVPAHVVTDLQNQLYEMTSRYIQEKENPNLFNKVFNYIKRVFLHPPRDPELQKARTIQKLVQESKSLNDETDKFRVLLLITHAVYSTQPSQFRNEFMKKFVHPLGSLEDTVTVPEHDTVQRLFARTFRKTFGDIIFSLEKFYIRKKIDTQAINSFLVSPPGGAAFCFVCIWHLRKNSLPGLLPKDIVKILYKQSHTPLLEGLRQHF